MAGIWDWHEDFDRDSDLVGYGVQATDGDIGKIDKASYETDDGYIVVDTGPWIFGKKVLLPAGVITSVDHEDEVVVVSRSKDEIKGAPEFDDSHERTRDNRAPYGEYYGRL